MALDLTLGDVTPFLPPLNAQQTARVTAWIPVLEVLLDARYGDHIDPAEPAPSNRVVFVSAAADAIERRLSKPAGPIDQQSIGGASVRYNARAGLSRWFYPEELDQLDAVCGLGGNVRSVRTPAPDAIRFGNLTRVLDQVAESDGHIFEED